MRYGLGQWPGLTADLLMIEEVFPVCSPKLLRGSNRFLKPEEILNETLIHDLSIGTHKEFPTWEQWLNKAGTSKSVVQHNLKINNSAGVFQSAIDGAGVALARSVMVRDDLAAGRLIRLFPEILFDSPLAYYVVYRLENAELARIQVFKDWLLKEVSDNIER